MKASTPENFQYLCLERASKHRSKYVFQSFVFAAVCQLTWSQYELIACLHSCSLGFLFVAADRKEAKRRTVTRTSTFSSGRGGPSPFSIPSINLSYKPLISVRQRRIWTVADQESFVPIGFTEVCFNGRWMLRRKCSTTINLTAFRLAGFCCT